MVDVLTQRLTREQIAAVVGNNPRVIKLFENLVSDVTSALPDGVNANDASILILQQLVSDLLSAPPDAPPQRTSTDDPTAQIAELRARIDRLEKRLNQFDERPTP